MSTKQPEALRLEYRATMPAEVLRLWALDALACIASLEAQLSAIGAGGVSPLIAGAAPSEGQHAMALKLLIAADFVSQAKADEAIALSKSIFTTQELSIAGETK
jgi:hypothetical protein